MKKMNDVMTEVIELPSTEIAPFFAKKKFITKILLY